MDRLAALLLVGTLTACAADPIARRRPSPVPKPVPINPPQPKPPPQKDQRASTAPLLGAR